MGFIPQVGQRPPPRGTELVCPLLVLACSCPPAFFSLLCPCAPPPIPPPPAFLRKRCSRPRRTTRRVERVGPALRPSLPHRS
eukprot:4637870-Pyramimonas_sp.AAC.1